MLTASVAVSLAQAAEAPPVTETVLDNGLRILVLEDHRSPIATIQMWYRVGSRNEIPGATGLAHFLEQTNSGWRRLTSLMETVVFALRP